MDGAWRPDTHQIAVVAPEHLAWLVNPTFRNRNGGAPGKGTGRTGGKARLLAELGMQQRRRSTEQHLGVGVLRVLEDLLGLALLDDLAAIHNDDVVRDIADRLDVMADEHHGQAELLLKVGQQVQNLRADRNVQSRGGLVGDDGIGVQRQGTGNCDALALAARKLTGKNLGGGAGQTGELQEFLDALLLFGLGILLR